MNNHKAIAALLVTILVVAGIGAFFVFNDDKDPSAKGGFYSWNPEVLEINSSYTNGSTPRMITDQTVSLYESIYGDMPSIDGLKRGDIPEKYRIQYEDYVTMNADGTMTVKNYDSKSDGKVTPNTTTLIKSVPDKIVSYQSSYVDTIYNIFCEYYGEKVGNSPKATAKLWETVVGITPAMIPELDRYFGLKAPSDIMLFDMGENMVSNLEKLSDKAQSGVLVIMSEYSIRSTNRAITDDTVNKIESKCGNLNFIFTSTNGLDRVFSSIEMIGEVLGMNVTEDVVTEMLLDVYVMQKSIDGMGRGIPTYYLESTAGKAAGYGNISTFILSDILKMDNIADELTLMESKLSDEQIITAEPDIILFYTKDSRTLDERMRVPVSV